METRHRILIGDARDLASVAPDSIDLVITSPPYPMIEMWDDLFCDLDPDIGDALEAGDGRTAFERMHAILDDVWAEVARVLVDGGLACVNVGDATRSIGGAFRSYPNHARVITGFAERGFVSLPDVLWRKPTNSAAKFMGSGMLPPNAYVTLEHEYILVFRNGATGRAFPPGDRQRYEAAYFWEERNDWFSDLWSDVAGTGQTIENADARARSGAFPVEIPYRLINMFSVYGDTVLDPFWGTGTTTLAAIAAARNSIGVELSSEYRELFDERVPDAKELASQIGRDRLRRHREFVEREQAAGSTFAHRSEHYDVPVKTTQERRLRLYDIATVNQSAAGYRVEHTPLKCADR